jgi:hypothetical protein
LKIPLLDWTTTFLQASKLNQHISIAPAWFAHRYFMSRSAQSGSRCKSNDAGADNDDFQPNMLLMNHCVV